MYIQWSTHGEPHSQIGDEITKLTSGSAKTSTVWSKQNEWLDVSITCTILVPKRPSGPDKEGAANYTTQLHSNQVRGSTLSSKPNARGCCLVGVVAYAVLAIISSIVKLQLVTKAVCSKAIEQQVGVSVATALDT